MKKIIAILIAVFILTCTLSVAVFATDDGIMLTSDVTVADLNYPSWDEFSYMTSVLPAEYVYNTKFLDFTHYIMYFNSDGTLFVAMMDLSQYSVYGYHSSSNDAFSTLSLTTDDGYGIVCYYWDYEESEWVQYRSTYRSVSFPHGFLVYSSGYVFTEDGTEVFFADGVSDQYLAYLNGEGFYFDGEPCPGKHVTDENADGYDDSSYNQGFEDGKKQNQCTGKHIVDADGDGYDDASYAAAYDAAYEKGIEVGKDWYVKQNGDVEAASDFVETLFGSIVSALLYIGSNIQFMGYSLLSIAGILIFGFIVLWIYGKVKGS